jgi:hypothetical protein
MSSMLSRDNGKFNSAGSSHASALIATTISGGKARRAASPVALLKAFQAMFKESFPPLTHDLERRVQAGSNIFVLHSFRGVENDLSPDNINIR